MTNLLQQVPYLREQRQFPNDDLKSLSNQVDSAYIDIANKVNARIIGIFAVNVPTITGEEWYITGQPNAQETLRQTYPFSDGNLVIDTGINFASITNFTRIWGTFFDGTYWQTLPYVDVVNVTNQISIKIDPVAGTIIITKGATAGAIQNGLLTLEWLSQF